MVSSLFIGILAILIFLVIDKIPIHGKLLSTIYIYIFFLFNYAVLGETQQSTFYALSGILVIALIAGKSIFAPQKNNVEQVGSFKVKGFAIDVLGVGIGLIMLSFLWYSVTTKQPASLMGSPTLAISSSFGIATIMYLGVLENRLFFSIYEITNYIIKNFGGVVPYVKILPSFIIPMIISAGSFAIFHWRTYGTVVVFPFVAFMLFLLPYVFFESDTPANVTHMGWNNLIQASKSLIIST